MKWQCPMCLCADPSLVRYAEEGFGIVGEEMTWYSFTCDFCGSYIRNCKMSKREFLLTITYHTPPPGEPHRDYEKN